MQRLAARRLRLATLLALCLCAVQGQARAPQPLAVTDALNLYDHGSYPEFFDALGRDGAVDRNLFKTFERDANRWVKAPAASQDRRPIVAASVALEIAHRLRDEPADRAGRYLLWASLLMRKDQAPTPSAAEHVWYLASVAGMEELDEPWALTAGAGSGSSVLNPLCWTMGRGGHLAIASRRFPDEPRFKLARVAFSEYRLPLWSDAVPSFVELARARAINPGRDQSRPTDERSWGEGSLAPLMKSQAAELIRRLAQAPDVVRDYQALGTDERLRAEIELHVGFLESVAMNWPSALDHLRRVPALTDEAYLRYLSQYFIGRTMHNMDNHAAAVEAFEHAFTIVPNARAAATYLAAELLLSDRAIDRDRAYPLLQAAYSDTAPDDPWRLYRHGDARLWSTYMAQLRQALT